MGIYAITGGASGIGAAVAEQLRGEGHRVLVADIGEGKGVDVRADLADSAGRRAAIDGLRKLAPDGLDGFIPCAGLGVHITPHDAIAKVNYFAVVETIEGLRDLLAKKRGGVVLVSSTSAPMAANDDPYVKALLDGANEATACAKIKDGQNAYAGAKRALAIWMRRRAAEYAADGIRLNAVAPGITATKMTAEAAAHPEYGESMKQFEAMTPTGGAAQPPQIASVIMFLLSPAASFVCGSVLFVDGGADAVLRPESF